jgi:hypothetical protein
LSLAGEFKIPVTTAEMPERARRPNLQRAQAPVVQVGGDVLIGKRRVQ